jgi:NitT/TauT family transport system ATP-binding protein
MGDSQMSIKTGGSQSSGFEVQRVAKEFRDRSTGRPLRVLDGVDMSAESGEFISIVGPSGCGKSTLLKIIAGFEGASSGQVELDGQPITKPGPDHVMVFQDYALFPWMNTVENVEFGLRVQGINRKERREMALDALGLVNLRHVASRPVYQLSGGMRQRVAIARALVLRPKILLMDEPFGALDAQQRRLMQTELMRIWQETGQTILFVTHSIDEAIYLSDTVLLMAANPGLFIHREVIELPRPREVTSAEFNEVKRRLWGLLEEEVTKTERLLGEQLGHVEEDAGRRRWGRRKAAA